MRSTHEDQHGARVPAGAAEARSDGLDGAPTQCFPTPVGLTVPESHGAQVGDLAIELQREMTAEDETEDASSLVPPRYGRLAVKERRLATPGVDARGRSFQVAAGRHHHVVEDVQSISEAWLPSHHGRRCDQDRSAQRRCTEADVEDTSFQTCVVPRAVGRQDNAVFAAGSLESQSRNCIVAQAAPSQKI